MAESDEAKEIVNQILEGSAPETRDGLYISDLVAHAREFEMEMEIVERGHGLFPCIRRPDDTLVPISLSALGPYSYGFPFAYFRLRSLSNRVRDHQEAEGISLIPSGRALDYLRDGMTKFLTSRIKSHFDDAPGIRENRVNLSLPQTSWFGVSALRFSTSGFVIAISAKTPGLRIHSSPTFRRSWSYFGNPTSPVKNALPGGIYEFGADGGPYTTITPDQGTFDIPYQTTTPSLLL
ncbi:hypothetical protein PEE19_14380 [Ralstonia solanacearum]